ncbi:MAG: DUF2845 domain-containing protein [Nitrospiraceae bacterium]|nr:MAG: DUF2845 domain-containing protein [Nitrospiraceae bacterium]
MIRIKISLVILILLISSTAFALRCGSDLILKGDRKIEVLKACGESEFREEWEEETVTHITGETDELRGDLIIGRETNIGKSHVNHLEKWTYNFGSNRFIQYLTFLNGRLRKIEDGPKGIDRDTLSGYTKSRCSQLIDEGDMKIEVIIKCGDPYSIEFYWEERFSGVSSAVRTRKIPRFFKDGNEFKKDFRMKREKIHQQKRKFVNIEEWTYNFGPGHFLNFITFENGKVVKVEDGDYGF